MFNVLKVFDVVLMPLKSKNKPPGLKSSRGPSRGGYEPQRDLPGSESPVNFLWMLSGNEHGMFMNHIIYWYILGFPHGRFDIQNRWRFSVLKLIHSLVALPQGIVTGSNASLTHKWPNLPSKLPQQNSSLQISQASNNTLTNQHVDWSTGASPGKTFRPSTASLLILRAEADGPDGPWP